MHLSESISVGLYMKYQHMKGVGVHKLNYITI